MTMKPSTPCITCGLDNDNQTHSALEQIGHLSHRYEPAAPYVYVASSWRNPLQPLVVNALRQEEIELYDFRNPEGGTGFAWSEIDPNWEAWRARDYIAKLDHPRAVEGFNSDMNALKRCTHCVLVLPCGRSAHLELGWATGAGKKTAILTRDGEEPELMAKMCDLITDQVADVVAWIGGAR